MEFHTAALLSDELAILPSAPVELQINCLASLTVVLKMFRPSVQQEQARDLVLGWSVNSSVKSGVASRCVLQSIVRTLLLR